MRLNLRTKLLLFAIAIAIVPLLVAGRTMIRIAQDELKSSANEQLVVTAQQLAAEINDLYERTWLAPLVLIRNAIDAGQIPGPRYLAASQEITVPGALGDETLPHLPFPEFSFGVNVNGADDMRKAVRLFLKYGVDSIKLNLSGDNFTPQSPADTAWMTDAEVAAAMEEVRMRGKRGTAHARSAASVKQALHHGIEVIYHASYTDDETLDLLEQARDRVFVAPGIAILYAMLHEAEPWGITHLDVPMTPEKVWRAIHEG